jgi:hypothetical protein
VRKSGETSGWLPGLSEYLMDSRRIDFGKPALAETADTGGKPALRVSIAQGSSVGSWQTKATLESGRYRLEGRVQTQGVASKAATSGVLALQIHVGPPMTVQFRNIRIKKLGN